MGYRIKDFFVSARLSAILENLVGSKKTVIWLSERASIILSRHQGFGSGRTSQRLGLTRVMVLRRSDRWSYREDLLKAIEERIDRGDEDLHSLKRAVIQVPSDERRSGAPPKFGSLVRDSVIGIACENPEDVGLPITHWTNPEIAREVVGRGFVESVSPEKVRIFLKGG